MLFNDGGAIRARLSTERVCWPALADGNRTNAAHEPQINQNQIITINQNKSDLQFAFTELTFLPSPGINKISRSEVYPIPLNYFCRDSHLSFHYSTMSYV